MKTTVIIPMAGQGSRFDYKFKPFLKIGNETFIERTVSSFRANLESIDKFVFVYLKQQESEHNVSHRLNQMFTDIKIQTVVLEEPTKGPAETLMKSVVGEVSGSCVICDCDHWLGLGSFFDKVRDLKFDCIVPTWKIEGQDIKSWSVVSVDGDTITGIAEKSLPDTNGAFMGVVGCIYFSKLPRITKNHTYISDVIREYIQNEKSIVSVELKDVEFFGDPARLETAINNRELKKGGTVFCDIDGTILEHEDNPSYDGNVKKKTLQGYEKLAVWKDGGYKIILTTARPEEQRKDLENLLLSKNVAYDQIIMDLPSSERHLINDRKPSFPMKQMAIAHEIERNTGLKEVDLDVKNVEIISRFKGGSMADTFLIKKDNKAFVRKIVSKKSNLSLGYLKLKKQYQELNKMNYLDSTLFPNVIGESENSYEYFYDMEYLSGFQSLSNYQSKNQLTSLKLLFPKLQKAFYNNRTREYSDGNTWLMEHLSNKIYSKFNIMPPELTHIINCDTVHLNGQKINGLVSNLNKIVNDESIMRIYSPAGLSMIHGDLTFENILYKPHKEVKLIDMDGANVIDAAELDLGKMFQSLVGKYESWSNESEQFLTIDSKNNYQLDLDFTVDDNLMNLCISSWSKILNEAGQRVYKKALFYMGLHFIRMIPFRLSMKPQQYLTPLLLATKFVHDSYEWSGE